MLPPVVLWIDPGLMTGLAVLSSGQFWAGEFEFMPASSAIESYASHWGPKMWLGWERYDIDRRRPQTDAHHAIEMIGVARWHASLHGCRILTPAQQHTPSTADRKALQAIGWWTPARNDAQSAACHMLWWLRREGEVPPRERAILDGLSAGKH